MCNCIKEAEARATERLKEQAPGARITEAVEIQNKALLAPSGVYRMYSEFFGRYEDGARRKKFTQNVLYNFCPFCGEKITPEL